MHVSDLLLEDFRNYDREAIRLEPGLNLVVGRNAQGKTNLLEAVHCLSGLGSPRGPDSALVRGGAERALIHGRVDRGGRHIAIDMELRSGRGSRVLVNKAALGRSRSLSELVVSVFFGPDELSLVKGSPDGRRRFLDELVVKLRPAREQLRREWERVLRQRNSLLKNARRASEPPSKAELEVWEEAFCRSGSILGGARLNALGALLPFATKRYEQVAGRGTLHLEYVSSWIPEEVVREALDGGRADDGALEAALRRRIEELRSAELERGMSLAGPQRDDVAVRLLTGTSGAEPLDARMFASQGDQRTAALALKLAEHDLLSEALDEQPILLLDDVFSELDPARKAWLTEAVEGVGQTLISATEPPATGLEPAITFEITEGKVRKID